VANGNKDLGTAGINPAWGHTSSRLEARVRTLVLPRGTPSCHQRRVVANGMKRLGPHLVSRCHGRAMTGVDVLRVLLSGSFGMVQERLNAISDQEWNQRAFPSTSKPGCILWHCARIL